MQEFKFAEILLPLALEKKYTYSIPENLCNSVKVGRRVLVNFGKRKLYTGIVSELHNIEPDFDAKEILDSPDKDVFVNSKQLKLWDWIADYYACMHGEVLNSSVPRNLIPSSESKFYYNFENTYNDTLSVSENKILALLEQAKCADVSEIIDGTEIKNPLKQLQILQEKGIINVDQQIVKPYKPLVKNFVSFRNEFIEKNPNEFEKLNSKDSKQKEILKYLIEVTNTTSEVDILESRILKATNSGKSSLSSLAKKGFIELIKKEESRISTESNTLYDISELSEHQSTAYNSISDYFDNQTPVLLHGVTSSGKTEIYIKLMQETLNKGKQVLYMLPEIALTTQIIERLRKHFGDKIGIFHSRYPLNNRSEVYKALLKHELQIVLGVRSSIFLPFDNLGLIVVDEEHESSYKQHDPDPRYNARDTAIVLSKIHNSNILLGSATPSVESYNNALTGKYKLVELTKRFGDVKMPEIEVVDLKDAYRRKIMNAHFHPILVEHIQNTLEKKEQVILFQNRRGYSPNIECKDCGWVPYCKNCNVSLTYHKYENKLICHYCGEKYHLITTCESCGSTNINSKGLGTERIEDEAKILFPEAKVARLDYDTAKSKKHFESIIKNFENSNIDILIGTQMITKGLDFANLTLVGILNADNMLNFPDFRAFERSYQLLAQVSGRAGRREKQGKVIIQTFSPDHPIIQQVLTNDYIGMFNDQQNERSAFKYPPFWNFIVIKIKHKDKHRVLAAANILADSLRKGLNNRVLGPEEPLINKISNYYILNIHIRFEKELSASKIKNAILARIKAIKGLKDFSSSKFEIDVDPI